MRKTDLKIFKQSELFPPKKIIQRSSLFTLMAVYPSPKAKAVESSFSFLAENRPFRLICLKTHCASKPAILREQTCRLRNGREEICLDKISFCSPKTEALFQPALWSGLIQPNLRAILFWAEKIELLKEFISTNSNFFDKLIIDSSLLPPISMDDWQLLAKATSFFYALSDLGFTVLLPYRLALAQIFDEPTRQLYLQKPERIKIKNFSFNYFSLLAAWLADNLKIDFSLNKKDKIIYQKSSWSGNTILHNQPGRQEICFEKKQTENLTIFFKIKKDTLSWQVSDKSEGLSPFLTKENALLEEVDNLPFDPLYYNILKFLTKRRGDGNT